MNAFTRITPRRIDTPAKALAAALERINGVVPPALSPEQEAAFQRNLAEREANDARAERASDRREAMAETYGNSWRHDL